MTLAGRTTGMRLLAVVLVALAVTAAAAAKEGEVVIVVGPKGPPLVEPPTVFRLVLGLELRGGAPPRAPYVLVFPLLRDGVPARPGRWYPRSGTLCSGWRSGVEAGCAAAPGLRGWLGGGIVTGLYRREPVRLLSLAREGASLPAAGNHATAVKLALHQRSSPGAAPAACVRFSARWSRPGWPGSFCVAPAGGLYAGGRLYPLAPATARFLAVNVS